MFGVLRWIAMQRGATKQIHCDNWSEFAGHLVDLWTYANGVVMEYFRPGQRPTTFRLSRSTARCGKNA